MPREPTSDLGGPGPEGAFTVDLASMPIPALASRDSVFVALNPAFEQLTGWTANDLVGRTTMDVLDRVIAPRDRPVLARLARNREAAEPRAKGWLWCRIVSTSGEEHPVRVEWRLDGRDTIILLLDARPEAFGQEVTEALARVGGALSHCATEEEVLERAVASLAERGFIATVLLWSEDEPLLAYGPSCSPGRAPNRTLDLPRPTRELLVRVNPAFMDRRAAFFQDGMRLVREAYPEPVAENLLKLLPAPTMVQAPLFLGSAPYGALVVTGASLTPLVATALDLFAELVGKALETVRLRRERVERERLAALGEAAGVMAHEVRNPVGAIMNALTLLKRQGSDPTSSATLLSIIEEETMRLENLVTQLLQLGRPLLPRPRQVAVEELTQRALRLLTTRGELREGAAEMPLDGTTMAWIDPDLAELALVNVLRNAAQSSKGAGLRLTIERASAYVRWTVEDEGPGIPDEVRKRLGQPFVTTRATGTGMGLAVVYRVMEASGGAVVIERAPRGGARVTLELPVRETPPV